MAEPPDCAFRAARAVVVGARYVLSILYTRVRRVDLVAYLDGEGPAPFVYPGAEWIEDTSGCSRSQVYEHLKALEKIGAAIPGRREVDGKTRKGWILPLRDHPVSSDSPATGAGGSVGGQDEVDGEHEEVRPSGKKVRPAGRPAERKSAGADPPVRPSGPENPAERTNLSGRPEQNRFLNREENQLINKRPAGQVLVDPIARETPPPRAVATRPHPSGPDGQPVGGASSARSLIVRLTELFVADDEGRRFSPAIPRHLQLAEQLLHVEGLPDELEVLARERLQRVLGVVADFADLCRSSPKHARWWGPNMLSTVPSKPGKQPAWDVVVAEVDRWRAEQRQRRIDQEVVQAQASKAREEAEASAREAARAAALSPLELQASRVPVDTHSLLRERGWMAPEGGPTTG
ncbi:MAG: hypothetical protein JNL82_14395 [Myxococcales bacterium]|nr:hypothetical protein [Myxococcales bacterium]